MPLVVNFPLIAVLSCSISRVFCPLNLSSLLSLPFSSYFPLFGFSFFLPGVLSRSVAAFVLDQDTLSRSSWTVLLAASLPACDPAPDEITPPIIPERLLFGSYEIQISFLQRSS